MFTNVNYIYKYIRPRMLYLGMCATCQVFGVHIDGGLRQDDAIEVGYNE